MLISIDKLIADSPKIEMEEILNVLKNRSNNRHSLTYLAYYHRSVE